MNVYKKVQKVSRPKGEWVKQLCIRLEDVQQHVLQNHQTLLCIVSECILSLHHLLPLQCSTSVYLRSKSVCPQALLFMSSSVTQPYMHFFFLFVQANKNLDMSINASNNFNLNITWSLSSTGKATHPQTRELVLCNIKCFCLINNCQLMPCQFIE